MGKLRRSTAGAIEYLREKSEKERQLKKEQLSIRNGEIEVTAARQDDAISQTTCYVHWSHESNATAAAATATELASSICTTK